MSHVQITLSDSLSLFFFDMTNSNIEVPEVGVQSLERGGEVALLCMTVCTCVGAAFTHATVTANDG